MKVLIADAFPQGGLDALTAAGCDVRYDAGLKGESLAAAVRDTGADVLVVRSTEVGAEALKAGRLGLVIRAGAGYNTIDVKTASALGIYVSNCPGKNSVAVAELAFGLMLALDRRLPDNVADLRQGTWNKSEYSKARGLFGRTLGIVGLGNIGRVLAKKALGIGLKVIATSRSQKNPMPGVEFVSLDDLLARSDYVSLHIPATAETKKSFGAAQFAQMKPTAFLINTARGVLIDNDALLAALNAGQLAGAALDVQDPEPPDLNQPLYQHPQVYVAPHAAFVSVESLENLRSRVARQVADRLTGKTPENIVNAAALK